MNGNQTADDGMILHPHVACERAYIGYDDVMADVGSVRQVTRSEDVIVRPHDSRFAVAGGAVYGDIFPECIVSADYMPSDPPAPFQVHRLHLDAGEGKHRALRCTSPV